MKKIKGYPCTKCQKNTDAVITHWQPINETCTAVRFKKKCCGEEFRLFTPEELKRYVKEESDGKMPTLP